MALNNGVWRSLVARSAGGREVAGSNPVAPIFSVFLEFLITEGKKAGQLSPPGFLPLSSHLMQAESPSLISAATAAIITAAAARLAVSSCIVAIPVADGITIVETSPIGISSVISTAIPAPSIVSAAAASSAVSTTITPRPTHMIISFSFFIDTISYACQRKVCPTSPEATLSAVSSICPKTSHQPFSLHHGSKNGRMPDTSRPLLSTYTRKFRLLNTYTCANSVTSTTAASTRSPVPPPR